MITRFDKAVLQYLQDHEDADPLGVVLQKSPFEDVSASELAAQLIGRKVAKRKFPFLLKHRYYKYPVKVSVEQSSSDLTAKYKSALIQGNSVADLTGGMGIDTISFAIDGRQVSYVEVDQTLCALNRYNFQELGLAVEVICSTAEDFLIGDARSFDWIYIDPSRRIDGNKKTGVKNLVPDVVQIQEQMLAKAETLLIKLSPMQDVTDVLKEMRSVKEVHVLSVKGDVKELLLVVKKGYSGDPSLIAVDLHTPKVHLNATLADTKVTVPSGSVQKYIYQPHPVVIKANLQDYLAGQFSFDKVHPNTQLYTSATLESEWLGRIFEVEGLLPLQKKAARKIISERKVNIISKNHPLSPSQIAKKLDIKEGGSRYLIVFSNYEDDKVAYLCDRLG